MSATRAGTAEDGLGDRRRWMALALLCTAQFMVVLDTSIVNVALPAMAADLRFASSELQWVVSAYALAFGGLLLLGGRMADLFGRRRMLLAGFAAFSLASLAGGLALGSPALVAARAAQGAAAAVVAPAVLSLITADFTEGAERNRALSVFGAVAAGGFAAGVILGGLLTSGLGWRSVMFVNVPIGIALVGLTPWLVRSDGEMAATRGAVDWLGAGLVTGGVALVVYAVSGAAEADPAWSRLALAGAAGVALLVAFRSWERRARAPLVRPGFLARPRLALANVVGLLFGASMGPTLYVLTLHLQGSLRLGPVETGLVFLPHALVVAFAARAVAGLVTRFGSGRVVVAGTLVLVAGLVWLSRIPEAGGVWTVVIPGSLLAGLGICCMIVGATEAATAGVAPEDQGLASGLFNTSQQIGVALGLAVVVWVAATASPDLVLGHGRALLACAGLALLATLAALALARQPLDGDERAITRSAHS